MKYEIDDDAVQNIFFNSLMLPKFAIHDKKVTCENGLYNALCYWALNYLLITIIFSYIIQFITENKKEEIMVSIIFSKLTINCSDNTFLIKFCFFSAISVDFLDPVMSSNKWKTLISLSALPVPHTLLLSLHTFTYIKYIQPWGSLWEEALNQNILNICKNTFRPSPKVTTAK